VTSKFRYTGLTSLLLPGLGDDDPGVVEHLWDVLGR
jgi:hypothetical protein